jgi:hypothetical protein
MKQFYIIVLSFIPLFSLAQPEQKPELSQDQKEVVQLIQLMFNSMRSGDSTLFKSVFHDQAQLHTTFTNEKEIAVLREESIQRFITAVGTPHEPIWDERIVSIEVKVDDHLATAWVPYVFYHGETPLHEGVNAFQLIKLEEGWKILQLTDTRRKVEK